MIKRFLNFIERGRKGYCREDLWSFDNWLSSLISRGLKDFKKNCHTYPGADMTWEEWMKAIDEMIECFEEQLKTIENCHGDSQYMSLWRKRQENKKAKLHRGLELLEKYYYDLWD